MSQPKPIPVRAVCHDQRNLSDGQVCDVTVLGCEFRSPVASTVPQFPRKTIVELNLLDEGTGRSVTIAVRITEVLRKGGTWRYRLRWDGIPELLAPYARTVEESLREAQTG
jgi:hypothetical protein